VKTDNRVRAGDISHQKLGAGRERPVKRPKTRAAQIAT